MRFDEMKARVQPALEQDFDAVYEEFVAETGRRSSVDFLDYLKDFGLIPEELHAELVRLGAAAPTSDDEETFVLKGRDELVARIEEELAASMPTPRPAERAGAPPSGSKPAPSGSKPTPSAPYTPPAKASPPSRPSARTR